MAAPDLELRGGPGSVLLALPVVLSSVIFSFLLKIREAQSLDW